MELKLIAPNGENGTLAASDAAFGREYNPSLVHQIVVAYQANGRQGTRAQKERGEVNKTKKKPWRQKGTGRARAGKASSPLWRGGGKTFPSSPDENFSQKVNRKMYRAGLASILSQLAREERLKVIEDFTVDAPRTKLVVEKMKGLGLGADQVLVITDDVDENLYLSSRNLTNVLVLSVAQADPVALVHFPHVLLTRKAVAKFEEVLAS
jgi:large subunit ribosomal protein L4